MSPVLTEGRLAETISLDERILVLSPSITGKLLGYGYLGLTAVP